MPVLYRKYRPQTFDAVVGQDHITRTIMTAIASGRVAHAYLFSGPRGVGKTTTARLIAKAVNCERRTGEHKNGEQEDAGVKKQSGNGAVLRSSVLRSLVPCNACVRCTEITEGRCVDVIEIDAASHTQVENVRSEIVEKVRIVPAVAARKVFIIDEVHMLTGHSFNALLKTIEEPPAHALFILATTELHKVPDTIRSRCQHFTFRRVSGDTLTARLRALAAAEEATVHDDVLAQVVRAADGSVRDAESLLGQILALGGKQVTAEDAAIVLPRSNVARVRDLLTAVARGEAAGILAAVSAAEEEGCDADAFLRDAIAELRTSIHAGAARGAVAPKAVATLRACMDLFDEIGRSDHPFFLIEVAMLSVAGAGDAGEAREAGEEKKISNLSSKGGSASGGKSQISNTREAREGVGRDTDDHNPPPALTGDPEPPKARATHAIKNQKSQVVHSESAPAALSAIRQAWHAIVTELAAHNHAIPYLLEGGRPQHITGNVLTIGFRYRLHADKVRAPAILDALTAACSTRAGTPLRVETAVVSVEEFAALEAVCRPATGDIVADAALEVFGGRVLD